MNIAFVHLFIIIYLCAIEDGKHIFVDEDKGNFIITCPVNISFNTLVLQVQPGSNPITECNKNSCFDLVPGVEYFIDKNGFNFNITLLDAPLLRTLQMIQCIYDNTIVYNYTFSVFARPLNVSCDVPYLTDANSNVKINCRTLKVYPGASLKINVQSQIGQLTVLETALCTSINYTETQGVLYFQTACTWISQLSNFDAGNYSFNVSMYPSNANDIRYEVNVTPLQVLQLSFPTVKLSSECFTGPYILEGYIKPRASINCMCYLETIGYPPGIVKWINSGGTEVGLSLNATFQMLIISENMDTGIYNCSASTTFQSKNFNIPYTVNYAKGPSKCEVKPENSTQTVWNMCTNSKIKLPIVCISNISNVKPSINTIIYINTTASGILSNETVDKIYRAKYDAVISEPGTITTSCLMRISVFNDVTVSCSNSQVLQVIASPKSDPILKINSYSTTNQLDVEENKDYVLECTVLGGVPLVSNVTVSCGDIYGATQSGSIFTSHVTFTRNMTGQNCTCSAQHISNCYQRSIIRTCNVIYAPIIISFTPQFTQIVENGDSLEFICAADGNPPPSINISRGLELLSQTSSGYMVALNKSMSCTDTGQFKCQAYDGINSKDLLKNQEKSVMINVKCSLQFNNSEGLIKEFNYQVGETFLHRLIVYGYPGPSQVDITKLDRTSHNFNVSYSPLDPPYVSIEIKIIYLTISDIANYTLTIFQDGSKSLIYTFYIKVVKTVDETNVGAIVGGTLAGLALIILIIVAVLVARKYSIKCSCSCIRKTTREKREDRHYSELSVTRQNEDNHTYETPNINLNRTRDSAHTSTTNEIFNYVNVQPETYQNAEKSLYDEIIIDAT